MQERDWKTIDNKMHEPTTTYEAKVLFLYRNHDSFDKGKKPLLDQTIEKPKL